MKGNLTAMCAECGHRAAVHDDLGCATPIAVAGKRTIYCDCPWLMVRVAFYPQRRKAA